MDKQFAGQLEGKKVAILATDGFEQSELMKPHEALLAAGAIVDIVSLKAGQIKGWDKKNWGQAVDVTLTLADADSNDYDALVLPGGVMNPDSLRISDDAVNFVRAFVDDGRPIAAICHGPWTLINAGGVNGRTMTSWPSLRMDLENAGAIWVDEDVHVDQGLVTSRKPADLPAFCKKMIEEILEGPHGAQRIARDQVVETIPSTRSARLQ